ncbi:MAG: prepilin-type N-terminal cleavage/methylation domain-containing protein [Planctomycetota bacterium]
MRFGRTRGLTLIEVLASLVLLSTLLVAILQSHDRLARQTKTARERIDAIDAADELLQEWASVSPMVIPSVSGQTATDPTYDWTIETRIEPELETLGIRIATLRLFEAQQSDDTQPLAMVEFLTTSAISEGIQ